MDVPLGSAGVEESNELERLRRRAYGPDADIAGDAAALARLTELEVAHRQLAPSVVGPAGAPAPERIPVAPPVDGGFAGHELREGSVTEKNPSEAATAESEPADGAPASPWWRRRRGLVLGGAIAALALNTVLVAWMTQPPEASTVKMPSVPDTPTRPDGQLAPDYVLALESVGAEADKPNDRYGTLTGLGISSDELRRYEDFRGMNVWSGESRYGIACLLVAVPLQGLREGFGAEGCSPGGLDITVDLVDGPTDSLLTRFVLDGDHINVYIYERAPDPGAPQSYWVPEP